MGLIRCLQIHFLTLQNGLIVAKYWMLLDITQTLKANL